MVAIDWINHELHPHHTLKLECRGTPYKCDGCQELGFHSRYTCKEKSCSFHLHTECAEPRSSLSHPFFKNCSFRFLTGIAGRVCDACGMDAKGYIYHCDGCGKDLHPCCAKLERVIEDGEVKLVLKKEMPSKCYICDMKNVEGVSTWGYVSTCKTYSLHISCVKEHVLKSWMKQTSFGGGGADGSPKGEATGGSDGRALVNRTPMLQLVVRGKQGAARASAGKFAKIIRTIKIAIPFIIAAILGDPTAIVAGLIANLIAH